MWGRDSNLLKWFLNYCKYNKIRCREYEDNWLFGNRLARRGCSSSPSSAIPLPVRVYYFPSTFPVPLLLLFYLSYVLNCPLLLWKNSQISFNIFIVMNYTETDGTPKDRKEGWQLYGFAFQDGNTSTLPRSAIWFKEMSYERWVNR